MCVELFVDNLLVYSDCESPSPAAPSPFLDDTNIAPSSLITDLITTVNTLNISLNRTLNTTVNTTLNTSLHKSTSEYTPLPDNTLAYVLISLVVIVPCIIWCIVAMCRSKKKTHPKNLRKKKKCCCAKEKKLPVREPKGTQTRKIIKD